MLNHALKTHLNLTLSMGLGQECLSRMDIPAGFAQARRLAALRFFDGPAAFHSKKEETGRPFITKGVCSGTCRRPYSGRMQMRHSG